MDLTAVAVVPSLAALTPLLPPPPARVLEVGCGRGALAEALAGRGYRVTGLDRSEAMVAATAARGVRAVHADVREHRGEYDAVLFTRSLHNCPDPGPLLAHVATLLAPGGRIVLEEFAWERVDRGCAEFLYDNRAVAVAAGLLDAEVPETDLLGYWVAKHDFLCRGADMLAALAEMGTHLVERPVAMAWRMVAGPGDPWTADERVPAVLAAVRRAEERRLAEGRLTAMGFVASAVVGAPS
ncbi:SAM-dependent methyltransferase [Crossiella equi]|uniref:SAM-dependent methyltransferase n=1 Tax=Crossiella equi TaxID=130796 RepID=A0ABS5AQU4_9PSEU|nr:class I SAM-dependent methyltransferase [Crossiella equi]MBP2478939.1 SAM-dependent methyltransferase [Crossiella equi]